MSYLNTSVILEAPKRFVLLGVSSYSMEKYAGETTRFYVNFSKYPELRLGEILNINSPGSSSATVLPKQDLTVSDFVVENEGMVLSFLLTGGTPDILYTITLTVTTDVGSVLVGVIQVLVK